MSTARDIARAINGADDAAVQAVAEGMRAHLRRGPWWRTWWAALRDWARETAK